jgi:tRNA nucleotidyltransferase (CCA-adding enzyme)
MAGERDIFETGDGDMGVAACDFDIEVFGISWDVLRAALTPYFQFDEVGETFCVMKLKGSPIDISIPRRENSSGAGHKDFDVIGDPHMLFEDAARRRDFTMNAMGYDPLEDELLDPMNGRQDILLRYVRHVSDRFVEDPLRPVRAARFAARFGFDLATPTEYICDSMRGIAKNLPSERVWIELRRAMLESDNPSTFFNWLMWIRWITELFPEIADTFDIDQDPEWHPEGDVYQHTMHAIDYWAQNLKTGNDEDDLIVALSVLCHDFGKVTTTEFVDGKIRARGHEEAGAEPTRTFLHRMRQYELAKQVIPIVENHLYPLHVENFSTRGIRRLATKVPRLDLLAIVSRADVAGRPPIDPRDSFAKIDEFERMVAQVDSPVGGPKRLATGDMLIELGLSPGPIFKTMLDHAYELQLDGVINTPEEARQYLYGLESIPKEG